MRRTLLLAALLVAGCSSGSPTKPTTVTPTPYAVRAHYAANLESAAYRAFSGGTDLDPEQAALCGPHMGFAFDGVAVAPAITAEQAATLHLVDAYAKPGLVPADGYEFLVLHTAQAPNRQSGMATTQGTWVEVRSGGENWTVEASFTPDQTLILSVHKGVPAQLVLNEEGRAQTLDLRTGKRGADAIALYYPTPSGDVKDWFESWARVSGVRVPATVQNLVSIGGPAGLASLRPHLGDRGWAKPGRAWLYIGLRQWQIINPDTELKVDVAASFRLILPNGQSVAPAGGSVIINYLVESGSSTGLLIFDVPDSFRSGKVTFSPHGTVEVDGRRGTFGPYTATKSVAINLTR